MKVGNQIKREVVKGEKRNEPNKKEEIDWKEIKWL